MGFLKPGYFLQPAKEFIGKLKLLDLGLPVPNFKPNIKLIKKKILKIFLLITLTLTNTIKDMFWL